MAQGQRTDLSQVTPALYEHACSVYRTMLLRAVPDEEIPDSMVYEGHLTRLFKDLRLSVPYYTQIKNLLVAMRCIEQVKRGGGSATSRWLLWREPTLEDFQVALGQRTFVSRNNKMTILEQQLRDLTKRLAAVESALALSREKVS